MVGLGSFMEEEEEREAVVVLVVRGTAVMGGQSMERFCLTGEGIGKGPTRGLALFGASF